MRRAATKVSRAAREEGWLLVAVALVLKQVWGSTPIMVTTSVVGELSGVDVAFVEVLTLQRRKAILQVDLRSPLRPAGEGPAFVAWRGAMVGAVTADCMYCAAVCGECGLPLVVVVVDS